MAAVLPPVKPASAPTSPTQNKDDESLRVIQMTRFGEKTGHRAYMSTEKRFSWQRPLDKPDVMYTLPSTIMKQAVVFGTSTRADWECTRINKKDTYNPNAGPGSYRVKDEHKVLSTQRNTRGGRFNCAPRQGMGMKTPGPGPAYDLSGVFKNGKDRRVHIGFNKDDRKPLADNLTSRTDAMYTLKFPPSRTCKFGSASSNKSFVFRTCTPGPIYDLSKQDFRTGPRFSFGKSKASRFEKVAEL